MSHREPQEPFELCSKPPPAPRIFDAFAEATRHRLIGRGELVQVFELELSDLQRQLLELPGMLEAAHLSGPAD